jgi:ATP-dependent protease ClpP protease subunit
MQAMQLPSLQADVRLYGTVQQGMLDEFFRQQAQAPNEGPLVIELSTSGGDADVGRRIALELGLWQREGRELFFLGKTQVYSAGITIMSAFEPARRFLTADCELLIHERKMQKEVRLDGALRGCRSTVQDILAEIDSGQRLEREGFAQLVRGTTVTIEDLEKKILSSDWYLTAEEARKAGLVGGIV